MLRTTMGDLIEQVRILTATTASDYTIGSTVFWTNQQIQDVLDANRMDVIDEPLHGQVEYNSGGTAVYHNYQSQYRWMESTDGGTAIFYLRDSTGTRAGTADYSVNYQSGRVSLTPNTLGTVYYLTARTYDVYAAAATIWRNKAAHVASRFDFSADGASFKSSQLRENYLAQAREMENRSSFGESSGVRSVTMTRDDIWAW